MAAQLAGVPYAALPKAASRAAGLSIPPRLVVIHDTSNSASAEAEARYAATRTDPSSDWTSSHFYVDNGGPLGSLPLNKQAWAAYSYANGHAWQIEMCGYNAGTPGAVPAATIALTAALVRQLCDLGNIPIVKLSPEQVAAGQRGICGHRDITIGLGVGDHDDPGPRFDWPAFITAVKEEEDMTPDEVRKQVALGLYDALYVAANQRDYNGLIYSGPGSVGASIRANLGSLAAAPVLAALGSLDAVDETKLAAALAPAVADAVLSRLPDDGPVSREDLEAALRAVLGSVDGATPQGS